jgi:hypothetical protein
VKRLAELNGRSRRRHRKLLKLVLTNGFVYVRGEPLFRAALRLHREGLISAHISKWNLIGAGRRWFRELELLPPGDERKNWPKIPRRCRE